MRVVVGLLAPALGAGALLIATMPSMAWALIPGLALTGWFAFVAATGRTGEEAMPWLYGDPDTALRRVGRRSSVAVVAYLAGGATLVALAAVLLWTSRADVDGRWTLAAFSAALGLGLIGMGVVGSQERLELADAPEDEDGLDC
jgi:hypothetical protein